MSRSIEGIGMTSRRTRERMITRLRQQGISNQDVLAVMTETPRHIFVDEALASRAYEDIALPIGHNQTISQPYIVAKMTELLLEKIGHIKCWKLVPVAVTRRQSWPNWSIRCTAWNELRR